MKCCPPWACQQDYCFCRGGGRATQRAPSQAVVSKSRGCHPLPLPPVGNAYGTMGATHSDTCHPPPTTTPPPLFFYTDATYHQKPLGQPHPPPPSGPRPCLSVCVDKLQQRAPASCTLFQTIVGAEFTAFQDFVQHDLVSTLSAAEMDLTKVVSFQ